MKIEQILKKYSLFRRNMGIPIDREVLFTFWGKEVLEEMNLEDIEVANIRNSCLTKKVQIARDSVKYLVVFNWVQFIAISGSVASGFAKEGDDIDIFVVIKKMLWAGVPMLVAFLIHLFLIVVFDIYHSFPNFDIH